MKRLLVLIILGTASTFAVNAYAQEELSEEVSENVGTADSTALEEPAIPEESLYKNEADTLMENKVERLEKKPETFTEDAPKSEKLKSISELDKLTPFNDIAVIQKRFLPKSQRFEFNPNLGLITNNAFFMTTFLQGRLAYAITEKWAIEAIVAVFMDQKYKVTKDLEDEASVQTTSLLLPEMYYGADIRWSPIYGKMGSFSEGIVPFDMYFSLGAGIMDTNQEDSPLAIHVGTGQIFGLNKWMAFRWDLSGYMYSSEVTKSNGTGKNSDSFTDVQLSLGMSFFFPDATYR
ncbi:MAG: outer membrane beta-barrel domain-containing protein [Bdellovibrionota bacterium]